MLHVHLFLAVPVILQLTWRECNTTVAIQTIILMDRRAVYLAIMLGVFSFPHYFVQKCSAIIKAAIRGCRFSRQRRYRVSVCGDEYIWPHATILNIYSNMNIIYNLNILHSFVWDPLQNPKLSRNT